MRDHCFKDETGNWKYVFNTQEGSTDPMDWDAALFLLQSKSRWQYEEAKNYLMLLKRDAAKKYGLL